MKSELNEKGKALCRKLAEELIPSLKDVAREHGYCLLAHGSLSRDIDLVACPWTEDAVSPDALAECVRKKAEEIRGVAFIAPHEEAEFPRQKPHGRQCWSFHLGGGPYIDLSVMPRHL